MPRSGGLKSPAKMLSRSAPTSPKNLKDLTKSSTLPPPRPNAVIDVKNGEGGTSNVVTTNDGPSSSSSVVGASPRKSRNATFSNFFKKLSPKLRQSSSSSKNRDKTWYVVEIAQRDVDGQQPTRDVHETPPDLGELGSSSSRAPLETRTSSKNAGAMSVPRNSSMEDSSSKPTLSDDSGRSSKQQSESTTTVGNFTSTSSYEEAKVQQVNASFGGGVGSQPVIRINSSGSAPTQTDSNSSNSGGGSSSGCGGVGVGASLPPSGPPRVRRTHQPPRTLNILNKIVVQHPYEVDKIKGKMTSVESIGSCSLDVDATASESSATADGRASSVSQRTLHSASVDLGSGVSNILGGGIQTESVRSPRSPTRISVKKSGSVGGSGSSDVRYISELYIPNGRVKDVDEEEYDGDKRKPSYISISCSVSGYTSYSCYNSKVREGLRSRDNSPARLAFTTVANGDGNSQFLGLDFGEDGGEERGEMNGGTPKVHTNSVLLNVNGGGIDVVDRSSRRSMYEETTKTSPLPSTLWRAASDDAILSCHSKDNEVRIYGDRRSETRVEEEVVTTTTTTSERISESEAVNNNNNGDFERKSLIQQRIERLYGPSALAQGFRLHRERRYNGETSTVTKSSSDSSSYPPVFKHLCPTFYDQLVTSHSSTSPVVSPLKSADRLHSLKTLISTDVKLDETSAKEIRTNGDISKHNGFHVETKQMLKGPSEEELLIVVNDGIGSNDRNFAIKDGKWFIEMMNEEQRKIQVFISRAEEHLNCDSPPEEACGRLRAAIGKANLLLSQKFQQFRGLCEKNLTQSSDEPFPTTASDLAGFWDMVLIQVQEIHKMFDDIEKMRELGWILDEKDEVATKAKPGGDGLAQMSSTRTKRAAVKKPVNVAAGVAVATRSIKADEAARTREEARKRLLEAKRKGRQQTSTKENSVIEIFVPEDKD